METEGRKDVHAVAQPYEVYDVFTEKGHLLCTYAANSPEHAIARARADCFAYAAIAKVAA